MPLELDFIDIKKDIKQIVFSKQSNSIFLTRYFRVNINKYSFVYKIEKKIRFNSSIIVS